MKYLDENKETALKIFSWWLGIVLSVIHVPGYAEKGSDPFQEIVSQYRAANPKPVMPELARKFKVQADFATQEKRYDKAIELYGQALEIAPWWPEGHYNLALVLGDTKKYKLALLEMNRYLLLAPDAPEARAAQDKIYQWESVAEMEPGKTFKDCESCPEMVELPAGSFVMGSDKGEADEKPAHKITIAKPFAIGKTEVTQEQWYALMRDKPSHFEGCEDTCPVEQVSWDDAQKFIKKINEKTGKQYRLPTEAEWEYACRAGGQHEYCGGDEANTVSWNNDNGYKFVKEPRPVAGRKANGFGLYDMSGNVWEWVEDEHHPSYNGAPTDGSAWLNGSMHVLRGGGWGSEHKYVRAAARHKFSAKTRDFRFGFRLARTMP